MSSYSGSGHCGAIAFDLEGEIDGGLACNGSICSRRASLLWMVPREKLALRTPAEAAVTYTFNKHPIHHRFRPACGIPVFAEGKGSDGNEIAAVNLRCIEGWDLDAAPVHHFDGRSA